MRIRNRSIQYLLSFFLMLAALFAVNQHRAVAHAAGGDRIYYFNMDDNGLEGSMMLVESGGSWGLVDAGHRKATTIQDANGATYATNVNGLSSQVYCRNGKDVANYMIYNLGVRHLDFIVGTHAHSDHVGGIPELAATSYIDASGQTCYLVDSSTTYYYKEYQHISDIEDDLARYSSNSWHNQAFAYQAELAMKNRGATLVDVSKAPIVVQGDPNNAYGDYITFQVGNMSFRLYNVHEQTNTGNENVNSIVTVMTNGNYTVVNLADINTGNGAIDKTSQAIAKDFGSVDIVVAGHHGYAGSNTKAMFDALQPDFVVVPNGQASSWLYTDCDLAAAIPYANGQYGTEFYNLSISPYAVVTDLSGNQVYVYSVSGDGNLNNAINNMMKSVKKNGWVSWVQTDGTLWSYFENGTTVKNAWRLVDGKWYHFDSTGIMQTGWLSTGGNNFFLDSSGAMCSGWQLLGERWYYFEPNRGSKAYGRMLTGWQKVNNKWYYLYADGHMAADEWVDGYYLTGSGAMATGWQVINGYWYYLNDSGKMLTGWQKYKNKWYYLHSDGHMAANEWVNGYYLQDSGAMATGWQVIDGYWYYLNDSGKMLTGWQKYKNKWYYMDSEGRMLANTWVDDYYLLDSGAMATGWQVIDGYWYYLNDSGKMLTGWQKYKNKWYYMDSEGRMLANTWVDGYYLLDSGAMATGWLALDGCWYYLDDSGKMLTGWQKDNNKWYFLDSEGHMLANTWVDGYYLLDSGAMATGWLALGNDWYYFFEDGHFATGWQEIKSVWYYFYDDGRMAADTDIDGYHIDGSGAWVA